MNKKDTMVILPAESVQAVEFENMGDFYPNARRNTPEELFDKFNNTVTTVEAENNYRVELCEIHDGQVPFEAIRVREFVETYDDFINKPKREIGISYVGKLGMEDFWRLQKAYNSISIGNRVETYGKSSIYQINKGQAVLCFLLNDMTHDGQVSYTLYDKSRFQAVSSLFENKTRYPASVDAVTGRKTRFGRIVDDLESVGATSLDAWAVLETTDSKYWYGELKKHSVFTEQDKQLLKSINAMPRVASFDSLLEVAEAEMNEAKAEYEANPVIDLGNGLFIENYEAYNEFLEKQREYWRLSEEHNSDAPKTTLEDYMW